jgi:branched-subunit amino acid aminotransferase/4-amino-4-deoxychorismate lyase
MGGFKLRLNFVPGFVTQRAAMLGNQQLWFPSQMVVKAGAAMNVFVVFGRPDGGEQPLVPPIMSPARLLAFLTSPATLEVVTPLLKGTILPSVTRASVLSLLSHHLLSTALPKLPPTLQIHATGRPPTTTEVFAASASGTLREVFTGTSVVVILAARIGWQRGGGADGRAGDGRGTYRVSRCANQRRTFEDVQKMVETGTCGIQWSVWSDLGCGPSTFRRKVHVEYVVYRRLPN